jgi:hypothetical protein
MQSLLLARVVVLAYTSVGVPHTTAQQQQLRLLLHSRHALQHLQ